MSPYKAPYLDILTVMASPQDPGATPKLRIEPILLAHLGHSGVPREPEHGLFSASGTRSCYFSGIIRERLAAARAEIPRRQERAAEVAVTAAAAGAGAAGNYDGGCSSVVRRRCREEPGYRIAGRLSRRTFEARSAPPLQSNHRPANVRASSASIVAGAAATAALMAEGAASLPTLEPADAAGMATEAAAIGPPAADAPVAWSSVRSVPKEWTAEQRRRQAQREAAELIRAVKTRNRELLRLVTNAA